MLEIFRQFVGISCTPEPQVVSGRVGCVLAPGPTPVPVAIALVAHEAPALLDLVFSGLGAGGVLVQLEGVVADGPPVRGPLPHVAHHVVEAVAAGGREGRDGRRPRVAVVGVVGRRELACPDVAVVLVVGRPLIAPGEVAVFFARAAGLLPFGLGGQALASPFAVGLSSKGLVFSSKVFLKFICNFYVLLNVDRIIKINHLGGDCLSVEG